MKKQARWGALGLLALLAVAVLWALRAAMTERRQAQQLQALVRLVEENGLQPLPPPPAQEPALVALGEALFFETELSGNRDLSCATCHHAQHGLGDRLPLSIGPGGRGQGPERVAGSQANGVSRPFVGRNAIALFNSGSAQMRGMFWDGRVEARPEGGYATPAGAWLPQGLHSLLAAQAMFPVTLRDEMRGGFYDVAGYSVQPGTPPEALAAATAGGWHDVDIYGNANELALIANEPEAMPAIWQGVMARLLAQEATRAMLHQAYPQTPPEALGFEHAANALAAYQTQAFAVVDTPWDRFLAGDRQALSPEAVAGAVLFFGQAGCARCHSGALLSDGQYHNIGAPQLGPGTDDDAPLDYGRWAVTGAEAERFAFRTPPLRNVALTGPWLHNGAYSSLEAVVRHHLNPEAALRAYDGAHLPEALRPTVQDAPVTLAAILQTLAPELRQEQQLNRRQIDEILAFLESLSGSWPAAGDG